MFKGRNEHGEHGWFKPGERSYATLLKSDAVMLFAQSYPPSIRDGALYFLKWFLEFNNVGPEEFLKLPEAEIKQCIRKACLRKIAEEQFSSARRVFYTVKRFLEINGVDVRFTRTEKKAILKYVAKKIPREYVPTREDIYRAIDAIPNKSLIQQLRARAIVLCLWQSGVRVNCLISWVFGMFKNQLYPEPRIPVRIKVVAYRPPDVTDCAVDTKLSSYGVGFYYTFLHKEAAYALKAYLDARMKVEGRWLRDDEPVFVTWGVVPESRGKPLTAKHVVDIVKNAFKQIGVDPDRVWTHCLRKAFRKTLYAGGVDPDIAEAMMGHKLPASRGSYFDYHDVAFAEKAYMRAPWERLSIELIEKLEKENVLLRAQLEKLTEELNWLKLEVQTALKIKLSEKPSKVHEHLPKEYVEEGET